jgi:regulator of sigma E protease
MIVSILYVILAILGLSFLIFIHELGHYYVARRNGMRVETFSIGFGKPLYSWMKDGVKWQIGWLLFGGYVKITGMEMSDKSDIYSVEDGFFSKSPLARIKVALAGPLVNIAFAFLAFAALWMVGGREKHYSEYTHKIGWVDTNSELYKKGVRPGDEIISYNNEPFTSSKDHAIAPMTSGENIEVKGNHVNLKTGERIPFDYIVKTYPNPLSINEEVRTSGILAPAGYLLYNPLAHGKDNDLPKGSPLAEVDFKYGDRIVWAEGEPIYSIYQLMTIMNEPKALLTVKRGNEIIQRRVPRVKVEELKLDPGFKEELIDWQFEAQLKGTKFQSLYTIPYNLNNNTVVENAVKLIDKEKENEAFPEHPSSALEAPLVEGDKILAVDGIPVTYSYEILSRLQQKHVNLIIEHTKTAQTLPSWKEADKLFDEEYSWSDLQKLASQVGLASDIKNAGNLTLLDPIVPKKRMELNSQTEEQKALLLSEREAQRKEIEKIEDPEKRNHALRELDSIDQQLILGYPNQDKAIRYNPGPITLFNNVFEEIWHTLKALVVGTLNPKWMSGPIGIVQAVHDRSMLGWQEALFWLGAISLNLGVLNLLPLPVLDGGTICFALYELITGKKLKPKTIEKLVIPFAILLIGFFIFVTYYDLTRLFH